MGRTALPLAAWHSWRAEAQPSMHGMRPPHLEHAAGDLQDGDIKGAAALQG